MKSRYADDADYENDPQVVSSICWGCCYCQNEPSDYVCCSNKHVPKMALVPRKKHCKYFWEVGRCHCGEYFEEVWYIYTLGIDDAASYLCCMKCGKPQYKTGDLGHRQDLLGWLLWNTEQFTNLEMLRTATSSELQLWQKKGFYQKLRKYQDYYLNIKDVRP